MTIQEATQHITREKALKFAYNNVEKAIENEKKSFAVNFKHRHNHIIARARARASAKLIRELMQ